MIKALRVVILFLIPIWGCEKDYYWEYKIINQTGYPIQMEGYDCINLSNNARNGNVEDSKEVIRIEASGIFTVTRARGINSEPTGIFDNMGIDSVNIIFDSERIIIQYCELTSLSDCTIPGNIAGYETAYEKIKTGRSTGENEYRFIYTITEEDYNYAVPFEE